MQLKVNILSLLNCTNIILHVNKEGSLTLLFGVSENVGTAFQ